MSIINKVCVQMNQALLCALLACISQPAQALIEGNLRCTPPTLSSVYTFTAGEPFGIPIFGTCTVLRRFPYSAGLNTQINYISGSDHTILRLYDPTLNDYIADLPIGVYRPTCLDGSCRPLAVNTRVPYHYQIVGDAPRTPGQRMVQVRLGVTSQNWLGYGEWFVSPVLVYNIVSPACTLSSPSAVNLRFGNISNDGLSNQVQSTSVSVNCAASVQATATLVPSQAVVSATTGVSRTTLAGLNMQAIWTDSSNPVNFTSLRNLQLKTGSNSVNLSFKPQLVPGQSPTGAFQSQYTLTINYK